jgi:hypothetical protein
MVGRVLTGNGITRYGDGLYTLIGAEELSDSERDALLRLCRQRLDGFREQRGEGVFAHHSRHRNPISSFVASRGPKAGDAPAGAERCGGAVRAKPGPLARRACHPG